MSFVLLLVLQECKTNPPPFFQIVNNLCTYVEGIKQSLEEKLEQKTSENEKLKSELQKYILEKQRSDVEKTRALLEQRDHFETMTKNLEEAVSNNFICYDLKNEKLKREKAIITKEFLNLKANLEDFEQTCLADECIEQVKTLLGKNLNMEYVNLFDQHIINRN
jgi:hypothetical protein